MNATAIAADMLHAQAQHQRLHALLREWCPEGGWLLDGPMVASYRFACACQERGARICGLALAALPAANDTHDGPEAA